MVIQTDQLARFLGATDAELGLGQPALYRAYIRDGNYQRVGELTDWIAFDFIPGFNEVGTWALETSAESEAAQLLTKRGGIIVTRELDGVERTIFSGPVRTEYAFTETTFRAAGFCDNYWLLDAARPTPASASPPFANEYDVRTGVASTIMRQLVDVNIGSSAPVARRLAPIVFPADPLLGSSITARANLQSILALLADLSITPYAGGLGFYLRQSDTIVNSLEFVVYAPPDSSADAKFSIDLGTIQEYEDIDEAPEANRVLVMGGDGFGANRTVIEAVDAASIAEWGAMPCTVVDMRGTTDTGELLIRAAEEIAKVSTLKRAAVTPFDVPSLQIGRDYDLGHLVTLVTHAGETIDLVRQVEYSLDPKRGPTVTPIVGQGDGSDEERMATITRTIRDRLSNMERNWNIPPNSVDKSMLLTIDAAADNEILTYDAATNDLEWQGINALAANLSITSLATSGAVTASGNVQGSRLISTVSTGTAPLQVTSTTEVANLNAARLQGHPASDFLTTGDLSGYLPLTGGTVSGALAVQGAFSTDSTTTLGNSGSDTVTVTGLLLGGANTAVGVAGAGDAVLNDLWLVNGANHRRLMVTSTAFQISENNNGTAVDLTIDVNGLMTIVDLDVLGNIFAFGDIMGDDISATGILDVDGTADFDDLVVLHSGLQMNSGDITFVSPGTVNFDLGGTTGFTRSAWDGYVTVRHDGVTKYMAYTSSPPS